jgi:hypothetical protein
VDLVKAATLTLEEHEHDSSDFATQKMVRNVGRPRCVGVCKCVVPVRTIACAHYGIVCMYVCTVVRIAHAAPTGPAANLSQGGRGAQRLHRHGLVPRDGTVHAPFHPQRGPARPSLALVP